MCLSPRIASCPPTRLSFNDAARPDVYTLSLHDALPICTIAARVIPVLCGSSFRNKGVQPLLDAVVDYLRSEEHTSELQSLTNLVCRLLLEKKKFSSLATPFLPLVALSPQGRDLDQLGYS